MCFRDPSPGSFRHVAAHQGCKCHVLEPAMYVCMYVLVPGGVAASWSRLLPCTRTMIDRGIDAYLGGVCLWGIGVI